MKDAPRAKEWAAREAANLLLWQKAYKTGIEDAARLVKQLSDAHCEAGIYDSLIKRILALKDKSCEP